VSMIRFLWITCSSTRSGSLFSNTKCFLLIPCCGTGDLQIGDGTCSPSNLRSVVVVVVVVVVSPLLPKPRYFRMVVVLLVDERPRWRRLNKKERLRQGSTIGDLKPEEYALVMISTFILPRCLCFPTFLWQQVVSKMAPPKLCGLASPILCDDRKL